MQVEVVLYIFAFKQIVKGFVGGSDVQDVAQDVELLVQPIARPLEYGGLESLLVFTAELAHPAVSKVGG